MTALALVPPPYGTPDRRYGSAGKAIEAHPVDWHASLPGAQGCRDLVAQMSPAQLLTIRLLGHGWRAEEIAASRNRSLATVRNQIRDGIERLGVAGQLQAVAVVRRAGVL